MTAQILQFPERRPEMSWTSGSTAFCQLPEGAITYNMTFVEGVGLIAATSAGCYLIHDDGTYTPIAANL